ncbi:hypothetical protein Cme02nite_64010 [Catellatospora methionotrophica]|uniref:Uncharacterized protein n=1 Tax=Catellatospora methionotrophica TaxID=121620 RepID=A0A8J3LM32_9ACTN|nr:hypothetical protein Cme02nite_64010 [Catellatospora methionotrophica]
MRRLAVLVHALLVIPLVAVFVVAGSGQTTGGGSGWGTVLLSIPVLLAGAPWSILTAQFTEGASPGVFEFLIAFPALLNLALHVGISEHLARKRAADEALDTRPARTPANRVSAAIR